LEGSSRKRRQPCSQACLFFPFGKALDYAAGKKKTG
jgi:hypothetical protein